MRIALVAPLVTTIAQPYTGGAQALLADLAQGLVRRGHNVTLFAREGSAVPGVPIEPIAVPISVHPADFSTPSEARPADSGFFAQANVFLTLFLQLQQRHNEFDLVHIHAFDWPAYALSTLIHNIPVMHTLHLAAVSPEINEGLRILHQQGHPLTLITVSQACAQTYAPYTPIDHIIYNGLDIQAMPFSAQVAADAPLLYAGRITPEKGVEAAIEIAEKAGRPLLIAGGVYDAHYYEERIVPRLRKASERITYVGPLERAELWKMIGRARGLLFPIAWDEPFGLIVVEAMAAGTPVIAFRRGAMAEIIQHGKTGFLVTPGDIEQASARVEELAALSRLDCRVHAEMHFSLEQMLDMYEHVYHQHK